jgi:hypothetical protein
MPSTELKYENVPAAAVPVMLEQLEAFGARITRPEHRSQWGICDHVCGTLHFRHEAGTLIVRVVDDRGHFPAMLLKGGIHQLVEEAVELVSRGFACQQQTA